MMTTPFDALSRHLIGIDRLHRLAEAAQAAPNYPPFNIEQDGEDAFVLTLAVAGFAEADLSVSLERSILTVAGSKPAPSAASSRFLHRGIGLRPFERTFTLADHVEVREATLQDGMLVILLAREVPEAAKPRRIPINAASGQAAETAAIEGASPAAASPEPLQRVTPAKRGAASAGAKQAGQHGWMAA